MIYALIAGSFLFTWGTDVNWAPWVWVEWSIALYFIFKVFDETQSS